MSSVGTFNLNIGLAIIIFRNWVFSTGQLCSSYPSYFAM